MQKIGIGKLHKSVNLQNKVENVAIVEYCTHYVSNDAYQNRESSKTDSS